MALLLERKKLIFIHIPKTGGMSIRHSLMGIWGSEVKEIGQTHNGIKEVVNLLESSVLSQYKSFAVLRNPHDWAVSMYHFTGNSTEHRDYDIVKNMSFDEYILWLCNAVETGRMIATGMYRTQSGYLKNDCDQVVDVLQFENLEAEYKQFCIKNLQYTELSLRKINESKGRKPYSEYFRDVQTIKRFEAVFQEDLSLFKLKDNK